MSAPTPFPELNEVLQELVRELQGVLAEGLVGVYLQGSFAVGGFDEHSDCDFVVAIRRPLGPALVDALQVMHARLYAGPCRWAQKLEGSYFPLDVLRSIDRRDEKLSYLDNGARSLIQATHCNTTVVRQTTRAHGVVLFGPAPASLIDPIPVKRLRGEILATTLDWGGEILRDPGVWANRFYQGFIAINFCRMWCDLTLGSVGSKHRGVAWATPQLDPAWAGLLERAWDTRPDPSTSVRTPADPDDYALTLDLVAWVIDMARRFAAAEGVEPDPQG